MKHRSNAVTQMESSPPGKRQRARRPGGSIYRRPGSEFWWIKFFRHGKCFRESTKMTDYGQAEKVLKNRLAQINTGTFLGLQVERILMDELAEQLFADYRNNGQRSLTDVMARWNLHLKKEFSGLRAVDVSTAYVRDYIGKRRSQGASNASINRELAMLSHMFMLGDNRALQARAPSFKSLRLKENNKRKGFLKDGDAEKIVSYCPELWFRALVECGRTYGWRVGELLGLRVGQVDLAQNIIRLEPGTTKNDDPREVVMTDTIHHLLAALVHGKKDSDYVFTRPNGRRVADFRATWQSACCAAGVGWLVHRGSCWEGARQDGLSAETVSLDVKGRCSRCSVTVNARHRKYVGLIFHDLRRTAARNLSRAGVPEQVVMRIGGWRTRSVFMRYRITDGTDMTEAAARIERAEQERKKSAASEADGGAASRAHSGHNRQDFAPRTGKDAVN